MWKERKSFRERKWRFGNEDGDGRFQREKINMREKVDKRDMMSRIILPNNVKYELVSKFSLDKSYWAKSELCCIYWLKPLYLIHAI